MKFYLISKQSILLVTIASITIDFFWLQFSYAPSFAKLIYASLMILAVFFFPYKLPRVNDFDKFSNIVLRLILLLSCIAILRSVFNEDPDMYAFGNKWITLFGNEYCSLLFIPPLFTYLATNPLNMFFLEKVNYKYMLLMAIPILFFKYPLAFLLLFIPVFFPYSKRDYRILICITVIQALIGVTAKDNPARIFIIWGVFALIEYLLVFKIKKLFITKFFCIMCIILPFFLFCPMLFTRNSSEPSFFEAAQTYVIGKTDNKELGTDTRTFLYLEMALDLNKTNSWIWGKGAYAHYYSAYFDESSNGRHGRMVSEVYFLNFLMHGGLMYVILYYLLLVYAVYNGLWKSNNKFVQCIAVIVTGWYFCSFISDFMVCRYWHMLFFMLLGCCLSKRFLSMSDKDVAQLFDGRVK